MENEVPSIQPRRRSRLTRGKGVTTDFVNDNASRLTEIVHRKPDGTVLSSFAYTFDPAGNITEMRFANGDVAQYDYDAKDQLTGEHRRGTLNYDIIFTYDPVGNRLKQVRSGDLKDPWEITYSYNAGDELLRESNRQETTFYGYDPNGNTTSKTAYRTADLSKPKPNPESQVTYGWDFENRMKDFGVKGPSRDSVYTYYADWWNRTAKTVNRRTERYLYDGDEILCDYDKNSSFAAMYVNGPIIDERLAMFRDGQLYYYLTDHLGSVRQLNDTAGNIKNSYDYEAYGSVHPEVEAAPNPAGFTGVLLDRESSLLDCRWRKYSPTTGRFLQLDREKAGYAYCSNNPLRTRDTYGTWDELPPAKPDVEKPKDFKSQWQDPEDVWCAKQTGVARLLCRICIRRILRLGGATVRVGRCQECYDICIQGCQAAYAAKDNPAYIQWCEYDCKIRRISCIGR